MGLILYLSGALKLEAKHLQMRGNTYHFRRRVPEDLSKRYPGCNGVLFFSLRTGDLRVDSASRPPACPRAAGDEHPDGWPVYPRPVPPRFLMPIVAMISFVGIYGVSGSSFDLMVMVLFGIGGWALRKLEIPLVPVILGTLPGNEMEVNARRAVNVADGDWMALISSPLAITLWTIAIVGFVLPILIGAGVKRRMHMATEEAGSTVD